MANETLGASFSIDVTDLKAGLSQANRMIRESESEFKAAAAGMDDWRESEEGLTAKVKSLNTIVDLQKKKVAALQTEYDRLIADGLDPTSKEAVELRTKINNETAALNKNEAELKKQQKALKETGAASKSLKQVIAEQETELKKLEREYKKAVTAKNYDAKAAKELKQEIDALNSELTENKAAVDGFSGSAEGASGKMSGMSAAAGVAVGAIAAVGAACVSAVSAFLGLAESTREARTNMARLETAFESAGLTATEAEDTFTELYGILGDDGAATEAAQQLAKISKDEADLAANTRILTGVMAEYGASIPTEGLAEGMAATAAMGEVQGVLADALEWQGVNLDDYNAKLEKLATEEERAAYIQSTLTDLYGASADAYRENNAEVIAAQEAQAQLNSVMNDLGAIAEPIMTTLKQLTTDLLTSITPFVSLIGEGLAGALSGADGAAESLATGLSGLVSTALEKIVEALPFVGETILALFPTLLSSILGQLPNILQTLLLMVSQIASSLGAMLPTLIPLAIDTVIMLANTLIDNIDLIVDAASELVIGLTEGIIEALPTLLAAVPEVVQKLVSALTSNGAKLLATGIELIVKLAAGLIACIPYLLSQIPMLIAAIVSGLKDGIVEISNIGGDLVRGLWNGISDMGSWIAGKLKGFGESVVGSLKKFFGIKSPSKLMADVVGKNLALGIGKGFEENIAGVNKQITGAMDFSGVGGVGVVGSVGGRAGGSVVVNQYNTFAQPHSRIELYKAKQATAAAVRLVTQGA